MSIGVFFRLVSLVMSSSHQCNEIKRCLFVRLNGDFPGALGNVQQTFTRGLQGETLLNQGGDFGLDCLIHQRQIETVDAFG